MCSSWNNTLLKNYQKKDAIDKIIVSQAFIALARMVWVVVSINGEKVLVRIKCNLSELVGAYKYSIEEVTIEDEIITTKVKWSKYMNLDYEQLLSNKDHDNMQGKSNIEYAKSLIYDFIAEFENVESKTLQDYIIQKNQISMSTFRRAQSELSKEGKIEKFKLKGWHWKLSET